MIPITIRYRLPFVETEIAIGQQAIPALRLLVDSGSSATIFNVNVLGRYNIVSDEHDIIRQMQGIGGTESVLEKSVELLRISTLVASPFSIQMGKLTYGMQMDGIIGCDFLRATKATIDFDRMEMRQ
jgi:hypothetical protein